jgi:hypothetical protein
MPANVFGGGIIVPLATGFIGFGSDESDMVAIVAGTGDPNTNWNGTGNPLSANQGSLALQTDTATLWQNTDGATAWANSGGAAAAAGFFSSNTVLPTGIQVPPGGAPPTPLIPHGLGRVPSFVHWSIIGGTNGLDGPGPAMPGAPLAAVFTADATDIIVDMSTVIPGEGGFLVNILAG